MWGDSLVAQLLSGMGQAGSRCRQLPGFLATVTAPPPSSLSLCIEVTVIAPSLQLFVLLKSLFICSPLGDSPELDQEIISC